MDKPAGPTSHDVVARVRRALKLKAVGHSGTLDPFATGLLVLLIGRATRLARFVEQQPKTYLATARLGMRTSTDDLTGGAVGPRGSGAEPPEDDLQSPSRRAAEPRSSDDSSRGSPLGPSSRAAEPRSSDDSSRGSPLGPSREEVEPPSRRAVEEALASFRGPQKQRPPAFSAKKIDGERSYRLARRGDAVELAEVDVTVHALELVDYEYPVLNFRATVSPGMYLRALGRDLGERLGTGAHLTALRREAIGSLRVEDAVALERVGRETVVLPPLAVLGHLPQLEVSAAEAKALGFGQSVRPGDLGEPARAGELTGATALVHQGILVAIAEREEGTFRPAVVLEPAG